jgi:biotin synthase
VFEKEISFYRKADTSALMALGDTICRAGFGPRVFVRGLIEFTNYCACDCHYCGIRHSNSRVKRYRLSEEEVLSCVERGRSRGIRTFVLQGGEDPEYRTDRIARLVEKIRSAYPAEECALTLSCGIRTHAEYAALKAAGANRYLLRFETSDPALHEKLRGGIPLSRRLEALADLKDLGFEVGSGFMVGLPGETEDTRVENVLLCQKLGLDMVGIGPFIPHPETPLADARQEPLELTLRTVAFLRMLLPLANLPATTAAGSLEPDGRERMLQAGANVLMPNISPVAVKKDYELYPHKICVDEDGLKCLGCLGLRVRGIGKELSLELGNSPVWEKRIARREA